MDGRSLTSIALAVLLVGPGCSTIVYGTTQAVVINTVPQGATVSVPDRPCVTPCKLEMDKGTETVLIELEGYDPIIYNFRKRTHIATLLYGNVITAGLGVFVDFANSAQYEIVAVDATLHKREP